MVDNIASADVRLVGVACVLACVTSVDSVGTKSVAGSAFVCDVVFLASDVVFVVEGVSDIIAGNSSSADEIVISDSVDKIMPHDSIDGVLFSN